MYIKIGTILSQNVMSALSLWCKVYQKQTPFYQKKSSRNTVTYLWNFRKSCFLETTGRLLLKKTRRFLGLSGHNAIFRMTTADFGHGTVIVNTTQLHSRKSKILSTKILHRLKYPSQWVGGLKWWEPF